MVGTPTYRCWANMLAVCYNRNKCGYKTRGAAGIRVDKPWLDFVTFFQDMGVKPKNHHLIRINKKLNYSKDNCVWAMSLSHDTSIWRSRKQPRRSSI